MPPCLPTRSFGDDAPLFSLADQQPTWALAEEVARSSPEIFAIWEAEEADAASRRAEHWAAVTAKQTEVTRLRDAIGELQDERATLEAEIKGCCGDSQLFGLFRCGKCQVLPLPPWVLPSPPQARMY